MEWLVRVVEMNYEEEKFDLDGSTRVPDRALMALVDGELSGKRRREVLQLLDASSDSGEWRRCALMFLEDQALRAALKNSGSLPVSPVESSSMAEALSGDMAPDHELTGRHGNVKKHATAVADERPTKSSGGFGSQSFWALAAGLAVAFVVGMQVGSPGTESGRNSDVRDRNPVAMGNSMGSGQSTPGALFANSPKLPDSGLRNADSRNQNWPDAANTVFVQDDNFWGRGGLVPQSVQQSFRNLGTEVKTERGWMPVRTGDGRQIVIPYENVRFVPLEQPSF